MRRGDLHWADLGRRTGRRPAVVLTRDEVLPFLESIVVAPVTKTIRDIGSEVPVGPEEGLDEASTINCDNLITIGKSRLETVPIGSLSATKIQRLDRALRFALAIRY